jgi:hypothetical protein
MSTRGRLKRLEALELGIAKLASQDTFRRVNKLAEAIARGEEPPAVRKYALAFDRVEHPESYAEASAQPKPQPIPVPDLIAEAARKAPTPIHDDGPGFVAW